MKLSIIIIASMPTKGMKSIGNVSLLPINKKQSILEKHITNIQSVFNNAEIIVVGGFENKKMQKLLSKYNNIKYVYHEVENHSNETKSFYEGLKVCKNNKCIVFNANCIANKSFWSKIKYRTKKSITVINSSKKFHSEIGATIKNQEINYIFYGLPHKITNVYLLQKQHIDYFLQHYIEPWGSRYLFETINMLCKKDKMYYQDIVNSIFIINSMKDYNKITKKEAYV